MAEAVPTTVGPRRGLAKRLVRSALGLVGLEIYRARGGVFIVPKPRAGHAAERLKVPSPCRLHLGCGNVRLPGWMNVDIVPTRATDLVADITRLDMFPDRSVEEIRMNAVYEHLFRHERLSAVREWHRVLTPGGRLHIDWLPDFDVIAKAYLDQSPGIAGPQFDLDHVYRYTHGDPVPWNAPEQLHKDIFNRASVERELRESGFEIDLIENACYRDEGLALNLNVTAHRPS